MSGPDLCLVQIIIRQVFWLLVLSIRIERSCSEYWVPRNTSSQATNMDMVTQTDVLPTGISRLAVNAVVVTTVLTALGTFLAIFRFCLRRKEAFGTDDYVLMAALVFLQLQLAFCFMSIFSSSVPISHYNMWALTLSSRSWFPERLGLANGGSGQISRQNNLDTKGSSSLTTAEDNLMRILFLTCPS